jgi:hypothetical protein
MTGPNAASSEAAFYFDKRRMAADSEQATIPNSFMRAFSKWLLDDEQRDFFEYLFALVLNVLFLVLVAVVLWPLGSSKIAIQLAKGYWVFWSVVIMCAVLMALVARMLRIEQRPSFWDAYLILILVLTVVLPTGWAAFAALTLSSLPGSGIGVQATFYVVGMVSCYLAYVIVHALFKANRFRLAKVIMALVGFLVFTIWPESARALFGWFFNLF